MGGRGGSSGLTSKAKNTKSIRAIDGVRTHFDTYLNVSKASPNELWAENTSRPHMSIRTERSVIRLSGNKKDKYALLENVNTAVVHLRSVGKDNPKREVNALNKQLEEIKSRGFHIWSAYAGSDETLVYVKRKLFTKQY